MPVSDWTSTQLDRMALDGSTSHLSIVDRPDNSLCLCTGSLGSSKSNDVPAMMRKYAVMGRISFIHLRNVRILADGSFVEKGHGFFSGNLNMYAIVKALVDNGFDEYVRPDHGLMIWSVTGKPGCGLYDQGMGAPYIN